MWTQLYQLLRNERDIAVCTAVKGKRFRQTCFKAKAHVLHVLNSRPTHVIYRQRLLGLLPHKLTFSSPSLSLDSILDLLH
jgi:hypothetical protein